MFDLCRKYGHVCVLLVLSVFVACFFVDDCGDSKGLQHRSIQHHLQTFWKTALILTDTIETDMMKNGTIEKDMIEMDMTGTALIEMGMIEMASIGKIMNINN